MDSDLEIKKKEKSNIFKPVLVMGIHNKTILRTDSESLPSNENQSLNYSEPVDSKFVRILNCHSDFIYLLCSTSFVKIEHSLDSHIIAGAVGGLLMIENCKNMTIIASCYSIQISNCQSCSFYLMSNTKPLLIGNNYSLQFAPYNTYYRSLKRHFQEANLQLNLNFWDQPILYSYEILKVSDKKNVLNKKNPVFSKIEKQTFSLIRPNSFWKFRVPFELQGNTKQIPFTLPNEYQLSLEEYAEELVLLRKDISKIVDNKNLQFKLSQMIRSEFENWLSETGSIQQIEDLVKLQIE